MLIWQQIAAGAGALAALIGALYTVVKYVVVPLARLGREVHRLVGRIETVPSLRTDLAGLSASFVNLDLRRGEQIDDLSRQVRELREAIEDVGQLLAEIDTDLGRLRRHVQDNSRAIRQLQGRPQ